MLRERFPASLLCNVQQALVFFSLLALDGLDNIMDSDGSQEEQEEAG